MTDNLTLNMDAYLPLRDVVFNTLREAILKGELKPGERLMELQLASKLGVSRTPIREAIRMLEQEGLAVTMPRKGAEVAKMTLKDMEDVLEVREALDELAAKIACKKISDEQLANLKTIKDEFKRSMDSGDVKKIAEEEKFAKTIDQGLGILADMEERMKADGVKVLSGEDAFKLYDTYGFPVDLTAEILEEKGFTYDEAGFESCMEAQRQKARGARKETNYMGADANVYNDIDSEITTEFTGYDKLTDTAEIAFLTTSDDVVEALSDGDKGSVIVPNTPFYATMGGQQGDKGIIKTESGTFVVEDTVKVVGNRYAHVGYVSEGMIRTGEKATLSVDTKTRTNTCRNHSATHLLQKALREVLGTHVEQAGSYQDAERTRFDFSHFSAMTAEELKRVEDIVNEKINEAIEVHTDIMTVDEAKKTGAMALFGEKYGEKVRVVSMGDFSKEFCGGTHVKNTSDIKVFKILSESGVAAGVRRIEAITGDNVFAYYSNMEKELEEAAKVVKSTPANLKERLEHLMAEMKALQSENESLKSKAAKDALGDVMDQVVDVNGIKLLATSVDGVDMNGLRDLGDSLKEKLGEGVIVLASSNEGKVNLVAMATDAAIKSGAHAGNLIKAIASKVGGGGGGRPNMAQAGGKNPAGIPDAIASVKDALSGMIK